MNRDLLFAGLLDASLFERLQLEPDLTLQDAIKCARNSAAVKQQQAPVRGTVQQASCRLQLRLMLCKVVCVLVISSFVLMYLPAEEPT